MRMSGEEELEFLGTWDYLIAFKEFIVYRLSAAGIKRFRDTHEIPVEIKTEDWMENRLDGMIERWGNHRGISFDDSWAELSARPYIDIKDRWEKLFKRDGDEEKRKKLSVTVKTSKDGWNTWSFRMHPNFKMKVWERADKLFQADNGRDIGVEESLARAAFQIVLHIREERPGDTESLKFAERVHQYLVGVDR